MSSIKIIGKIILDDDHLQKLAYLNVKDIAIDNPKNRDDEDEIIRRIGTAEAIVINISIHISQYIIDKCPNLKFIQTWSTGTDNIDLKAAAARNIIVKNVPDYSIESVAEKTIGLMIFIANKLQEANLEARNGGWNYIKFQGMELKNKTLAIVGKGKIGSRVGELASAFGMKIIFSNSSTPKNELKEMLSQADFITIHCPYNDKTHHLISRDECNVMKKGVYFINNARGGIVDEDALLEAINSGIIEAVSMDVFEQEPPAKINSLLQHPKVFVTPHCTWNTKEAIKRLTDVCLHNLTEFLNSNRELNNEVTEGMQR